MASDDATPKSKGKSVVRTVWPHGEFIVENTPTVTTEGVELSSADVEKVRAAAEASGVHIYVEGDN